VTVVSGLALGIDGAAHEGALDGAAAGSWRRSRWSAPGSTGVYPSRHLDLAHRIAARGLLLSEYPLGTPPLPAELPAPQPHHRRPRAGHAGGRGGPAIGLADHRAAGGGTGQGSVRDSGLDPLAAGARLPRLAAQGAKLVETAQDVLEDLRLGPAAGARTDGEASRRGSATIPCSRRMGYDPVGLDALIARTGIRARAAGALLELELAGHVARLPGGLFQRIAKRPERAPRRRATTGANPCRSARGSGLYWDSCLKCWCLSTKTTGAAMHAPSSSSSNASSAPMASNPTRSTRPWPGSTA
jgi:DNA processing protein